MVVQVIRLNLKSSPNSLDPKISFKVIRNNGAPYNCLFQSILQSAYVKSQFDEKYKECEYNQMHLKRIIGEYATSTEHWEEFKNELIAQHSREIPIFQFSEEVTNAELQKAYYNFITKYETLGTMSELIIASKMFEFNCSVLQKCSELSKPFYTVFGNTRKQNEDKESRKEWLYFQFIGNMNLGHWELLQPIEIPEPDFTDIPQNVNYYFVNSKPIYRQGIYFWLESYKPEPEESIPSKDQLDPPAPKELVPDTANLDQNGPKESSEAHAPSQESENISSQETEFWEKTRNNACHIPRKKKIKLG